jgi:hypothetical protein
MYKTDLKWKISVLSFENEFNFYQAYRQLTNNDSSSQGEKLPPLRIPQPIVLFHSNLSLQSGDYFDRLYVWVLEYLHHDQFQQFHELSLPQAQQALTFFAQFHAYFWHSPSSPKNNPQLTGDDSNQTNATVETQSSGPLDYLRVFPHGAWWRKSLRPAVRYETISSVFEALLSQAYSVPAFEWALKVSSSTSSSSSSSRPLDLEEARRRVHWLQENVDRVAQFTLQQPRRTLVHGDGKTSNLFFPSMGNTNSEAVESSIAVIDFQWCGEAGSGLADVVYLLFGATTFRSVEFPASLSVDHPLEWQSAIEDIIRYGRQMESQLLSHYHHSLNRFLRSSETSSDNNNNHNSCRKEGAKEASPDLEGYSAAELASDFRWEVAEFFQTALPQLLAGMDGEVAKGNQGRYGWLTLESDLSASLWLCVRSLELIGECMDELSHFQ